MQSILTNKTTTFEQMTCHKGNVMQMSMLNDDGKKIDVISMKRSTFN